MSSGAPSTCTVMSSSKLPSLSALRLICSAWYPSTSIRPVDGCTSINLLNNVSASWMWKTAGIRPRLANTTWYWWDVLVKILPVSSVSSDSWRRAASPSAQIVSGSRVSRPVTSQNTNYTQSHVRAQRPPPAVWCSLDYLLPSSSSSLIRCSAAPYKVCLIKIIPFGSVFYTVTQLLQTGLAPINDVINPLSVWLAYFVISIHKTKNQGFDMQQYMTCCTVYSCIQFTFKCQ